MAQVTPKHKWFEYWWQMHIDLAIKVLRDYQNCWLLADETHSTRDAVAVLLNIFAIDFRQFGLRVDMDHWKRSLADWREAVGSPESECFSLCPNRSVTERRELIETLCTGLSLTRNAWEQDGPTATDCAEFVQWIVDQLVVRHFVKLNYGS